MGIVCRECSDSATDFLNYFTVERVSMLIGNDTLEKKSKPVNRQQGAGFDSISSSELEEGLPLVSAQEILYP